MRKGKEIPVFDICSLQQAPGHLHHDIMVEPFGAYLERHPHLFIPHRHSFYHIVLFTKGSGSHTIDFEQFQVKQGQIYFMIPGQVHSWQFRGAMDGYVINFPEQLLKSFLPDSQYLEQFPFFDGIAGNCVVNLSVTLSKKVYHLLEQIQKEISANELFTTDMVRIRLLELFIMVSRSIGYHQPVKTRQLNDKVLHHFRRLVEKNYVALKLPKDYAALLHITPGHLNTLCKDILGKAAGEVIRDRVLLEAKRLLVNGSLSISEIAWQLNFADNSYFTKFFKKATGVTPELFRKNILDVKP